MALAPGQSPTTPRSRPMDGVWMVNGWYTDGVMDGALGMGAEAWLVGGVRMVWMVYGWCMDGVSIVNGWCMYGVHGVWMVYGWCIDGEGEVRVKVRRG